VVYSDYWHEIKKGKTKCTMNLTLRVDEGFVSKRLLEARKSVARVAIFDEMIDYHLDGLCTFEEAVEQFKHDIELDGCGYSEPMHSNWLLTKQKMSRYNQGSFML
jgi:hypothetical protein